MRNLAGFGVALILAGAVGAQNRGSVTPTVTGGFGSVVFPGGTPGTTPGLTRGFGSVVNPGGGGPRVNVPGGVVPGFGRPSGHGAGRTAPVTAYGYPVYVGGAGYYDGSYPPEQAPPQQQPNVTVVMPPQQATPIIINVGSGSGQYTTTTERQPTYYEAPERRTADDPQPPDEPSHYLIAFKDHTIYSAVAYWVDGDTLHYFTAGNTHNQVSVSLVDRDLTDRLNKESGTGFKLPAAK